MKWNEQLICMWWYSWPTFNLLANDWHILPLSPSCSIGKSVEERDLWVLEISDKPGVHQAGRPEVKFIGSIHGNEPVGKEIVLALANYLLTSYGTDDEITQVSTRVIISKPTQNQLPW